MTLPAAIINNNIIIRIIHATDHAAVDAERPLPHYVPLVLGTSMIGVSKELDSNKGYIR